MCRCTVRYSLIIGNTKSWEKRQGYWQLSWYPKLITSTMYSLSDGIVRVCLRKLLAWPIPTKMVRLYRSQIIWYVYSPCHEIMCRRNFSLSAEYLFFEKCSMPLHPTQSEYFKWNTSHQGDQTLNKHIAATIKVYWALSKKCNATQPWFNGLILWMYRIFPKLSHTLGTKMLTFGRFT